MNEHLSAETAELFWRGDRAMADRDRLLKENAELHASLVVALRSMYDAEKKFCKQGNWTRVQSCFDVPRPVAKLFRGGKKVDSSAA